MKTNILLLKLLISVQIFFAQTIYTSDNANSNAFDWSAKKIIAYDDITTQGRLTLTSSKPTLGDLLSLYDNRLDKTSMYGFGVESDGTLYNKAVNNYRWYLKSNADLGVSSKMELNTSRLFVNTNIGIGTAEPSAKFEILNGETIDGAFAINSDSNDGGKIFTSYIGSSSTMNFVEKDDPFIFNFIQEEHNLTLGFHHGRMGIGTTSPDAKLTIQGADTNSPNYKALKIITNAESTAWKDQMLIQSDLSSGYGIAFSGQEHHRGGIYAENTGETNNASGSINIWARSDGNNIGNINLEGNVGIGTKDTKDYQLAVAGTQGIIAEKVSVKLYDNGNGWPDYVFTNNYNLPTLKEVEKQIKEKGHLANIPSAKEVKEKGSFEMGAMNIKLLKKIEELTLYTIQQEKKIEKLEKENKRIDDLEEKINAILTSKK